jgi:hypothetical protein
MVVPDEALVNQAKLWLYQIWLVKIACCFETGFAARINLRSKYKGTLPMEKYSQS